MINYNNLLFKIGDPSIKGFDVLKRSVILYDLFIDLLSIKMSIDEANKHKKKW